MTLTFQDVEIGDARVDVRISGDQVVEVGSGIARNGDEIVNGAGGALIPGLHDHHLHLMALAAERTSVMCGPPTVNNGAQLARALRLAPNTTTWIRGVGYHESVAGHLDKHALDNLVPDRPARIQHRGGALWILNSKALQQVGPALDTSADVELDNNGQPNGRLWRYDARLRQALPVAPVNLETVAAELTALGITSVTDATPDLEPDAIGILSSFSLPAALLGAPLENALGAPLGGLLTAGPWKLLLRDHDLPSLAELSEMILTAHRRDRPAAVHCVTRESLLLTLAALQEVGPFPGDRIEHASIVPAGVRERIADIGASIVTQPDLIRTRGDRYLRDVDHRDLQDLYRYCSLIDAGIAVVASSDAPFGELDPWQVIRSAADRRTASGEIVGASEGVTPRQALSGYLVDFPGGPVRTVREGVRADLCLLHLPLAEAIANPHAQLVRRVYSRGQLVHSSD